MGATRNVVAFGAMSMWPMYQPQSVRLTINGLAYKKQPWSDRGNKYYLWKFESAVETDEVTMDAVASSYGTGFNEVEVWVPSSSIASQDAKNPLNPLVKATEMWNSFYCVAQVGAGSTQYEVAIRLFEGLRNFDPDRLST